MAMNAWTFRAASSVVSTVSPWSAYEKPTPTLVVFGAVEHIVVEFPTDGMNLRLVKKEYVGFVIP